MRALVLPLLVTAACMPPGNWSAWGNGTPAAGSPGAGTGTGAAPAPPPAPNLVATGAAKHLKRITHDDGTNESSPALSRDRKWLLYALTTLDAAGGVASVGIARSRADGRGAVTLSKPSTRTFGPSWLPNGTSYLAISDALGSRDIVKALRVAPNAAVSRVLSGRDLTDVDGLEVSPDGTHVAFHSLVGGVWTIGVARIGGSELTHLVPGAFPSWSPDGSRLAFHQQANDGWQLYVTDIEGGELTQLTDGTAVNTDATWAPDGRSIAFLSNRGWDRFVDGTEGVRNVFVISSDGTGLVALTDGARSAEAPTWGHDGSIYFASNDAGSWDIWRVQPDPAAIHAADPAP